MWKKLKVKAFFSFLILSAYFFMLTPLYTYPKIQSETIRQAVGANFSEKDCINFLKNIEKLFQML